MTKKTKKDYALEVYKTDAWLYAISSIFSVSLLVLLWVLNYKIGFWIVLIFTLMELIGANIRSHRLDKIMKLD